MAAGKYLHNGEMRSDALLDSPSMKQKKGELSSQVEMNAYRHEVA